MTSYHSFKLKPWKQGDWVSLLIKAAIRAEQKKKYIYIVSVFYLWLSSSTSGKYMSVSFGRCLCNWNQRSWKQAPLFARTCRHAPRGHIPFPWMYIFRPCQRQRSDSFHHPKLFEKVGTLSADSCYTFRFLERVNGRLSSRRHHLFICVLPDSISFLNIFYFFFVTERWKAINTFNRTFFFLFFLNKLFLNGCAST